MKAQRCPQSGFSLIQILIALAIMTVSVTMYMQATTDTNKAKKRVEMSARYADIESVLKSEVAHMVSQIAAHPGCLNYANVFTGRTISSEFSTSQIRHVTNLLQTNLFNSSGLSDDERNNVIDKMRSTPNIAAAVDRCARPVRPSNSNNDAQNSFYFCLDFERDATAPKNSLLGSPRSFAEVAVQLVDLRTGNPISCNRFVNPAPGTPNEVSPGAKIFTTLYWLVQEKESYFKSHSNSYFLDKETP
jgi:Tfp pilus assembly protein PilV